MDGQFPVVTWKPVVDAQALTGWDRDLLGHADYSIYQTWAWGEHRRASGWTPYRWVAIDGERIVAMAQGLLRRYPCGIGVMWLPGGPVGEVAAWNEDFQQAVFQSTGLRALYCRFSSFKNRRDEDERVLADRGWRRPRARLTTGLSLHYDLARPEAERLAACSRNWRHNLRRSEKHGLTVERWTTPDASALRLIYSDMEDYKHIAQQHSEDNLRSLFEHLGERAVVYRCRDASDATLACRACAVMGDKAWDLLAATAVAGRKSYASYATFWALMQHGHQQGIRHYDLSGVDPAGNRGVYDFKKGTGASPIEYLGEWEWACPGFISLPANWLIGMRRNAL